MDRLQSMYSVCTKGRSCFAMGRFTIPVKMTRHTVAIVQARMGSTRFPQKMLAQLGGLPLLEWVFRRVLRAKCIDQVVLATTDTSRDDPLVKLAGILGVAVCRGSEVHVLERFIKAAAASKATHVVRVCADNPFIDPCEIDRLVLHFFDHEFDYVCNHQDRLGSEYADGFGAEILSTATLRVIYKNAECPVDKEHVTSYLWANQDRFKLGVIKAPSELRFPSLRFDVDRPVDLLNMQRLVDSGVMLESSAQDIIRIANSD